MQSFLDAELFGRPVRLLLTAALVLAGGIVVTLVIRASALAIIRRRAARRAEEQGEQPDTLPAPPAGDTFGERSVRSFVTPSLFVASVYGGVSVLELTGRAASVINAVLIVAFSLLAIRFAVVLVNLVFRRFIATSARSDISRMRPLRAVVTVLIWLAGGLFLLDNLGFDITAVVAGLGIGGIAVALAAQALLRDLFAYFVIVFDRPFEIGDFLIFGEVLGSVERIGVKTTRIRSLSGEQVIVANADLTDSRVRNYKRMEERRIVFRLGVTYGTPVDLLERIPGYLREAVEAQPDVRFDRAHFAAYGDSRLDFEIVYYMLSPDYTLYMNAQQQINLAIARRFEEESISFAFPTRTVYLAGSEKSTTTGR